uniref:Uncharacterized protein n=1 Tax=Ditylenchus dipsaci TaxID=166011 RepID=A0A915DDE7_9BILA
MAESAKNALESAFAKTKEVLNSAAESTKGLANQALENVKNVMPGQGGNAPAPTANTIDPSISTAAPGQPPVTQ